MTDLQMALVADHRAALARDAAALRAERARDDFRDDGLAGTDSFDHRADLLPIRARIGRWLVALGEAVAGPRPTSLGAPHQMTTSPTAGGDGSGDLTDCWPSAA